MERKIFIKLFIVFVIILLWGCQNQNEEMEFDIIINGQILSKEIITIVVGTSTETAIRMKDGSYNEDVVWKSSNNDSVVIENGVITAKNEGESIISVRLKDGNITKSFKVIVTKVNEPVKVTGIVVEKDNIEIKAGESIELIFHILPENAANKNVEWNSSNVDIADVTENILYAKKEGTANISIITVDGRYQKNINVKVLSTVQAIRVTGIAIEKVNIEMKIGEMTKPAVKVLPENATDKTIIWKSSNTTAASVTAGEITAKQAGDAEITATTRDGNFSKIIKVKVVGDKTQGGNQYTLEQAMSDNAQLSTIAFSGLAFITGSSGADTFMPPGKVADFFGFQYMRDVDTAGYGHNTTFLSRVANNVLYILNDTQKAKLVELAKIQAPLYINFAYNRFPLMNAFRRNLEGNTPSGATGLSIDIVSKYTASLYKTDAELSYNRAVVVGEIINSFTDDQKAYLAKMEFNNYLSWPDVKEDETLKKSMNNTQFVAVMTYASEMFSWYKGSLDADVYFCPERHGTYFGGFYMKDYPAMNNPDYFISTAVTGDSGQEFLKILTIEQRALITGIIEEQRASLTEIAQIRNTVSTELRKAMTGGVIDKEKVYTLIMRYGELDGKMSGLYAQQFADVNKTLTAEQNTALTKLRNLDVVPQGAYLFSTPVAMPQFSNTDYMFGVGSMPSDAGQIPAPATFGNK